MSAWHRPDVETSTLEHLAQVVGPTSARQMVDGLLAKGRKQRDAEVDRLLAERHATNEALDDAVKAIREKDQRTAELQDELTEQQRYAAALEAAVCQCQPVCEDGEYMHEADCPVVPIQMEAAGLPKPAATAGGSRV